eukprot:4540564-Amphidinium_carterae.1
MFNLTLSEFDCKALKSSLVVAGTPPYRPKCFCQTTTTCDYLATVAPSQSGLNLQDSAGSGVRGSARRWTYKLNVALIAPPNHIMKSSLTQDHWSRLHCLVHPELKQQPSHEAM